MQRAWFSLKVAETHVLCVIWWFIFNASVARCNCCCTDLASTKQVNLRNQEQIYVFYCMAVFILHKLIEIIMWTEKCSLPKWALFAALSGHCCVVIDRLSVLSCVETPPLPFTTNLVLTDHAFYDRTNGRDAAFFRMSRRVNSHLILATHHSIFTIPVTYLNVNKYLHTLSNKPFLN